MRAIFCILLAGYLLYLARYMKKVSYTTRGTVLLASFITASIGIYCAFIGI